MNNDMNNNFNYQNQNYPAENDSTSSGGYGSSTKTFSPSNQRHADPTQSHGSASETGLIDQSLDGGPLGGEIEDAKQGVDARAREKFAHDARRNFGEVGMNPYGRNSESGGEREDGLAGAYAGQRARQYESGGAGGADADAGTM